MDSDSQNRPPKYQDSDSGITTLLIGLDAAHPAMLRRLFDDGAMPTLQRLFERGINGDLSSQIPPWTASAWPSLYTGTNPGKHGVFSFLHFEGYDWDIVNADHVREWSMWELCSLHGLTSVVVNVPVTYPPPEIDGAIVPGYMAPERPRCHPRGLFTDLRRAIGEYRIYPSLNADIGADTLVAEMQDLVRQRSNAFQYLADRFEPDFGFVQFQQTDTVFHEFPGDYERARAVYQTVDEEVSELLTACSPRTVFVVSDHGMEAYSFRFNLNQYLRNQGIVRAVSGGEGMPAWSVIRDRKLRYGIEETDRTTTFLDQALGVAAAMGLTSQRVGGMLDSLGLLDMAMRYVPSEAIRAASEQVDFEHSRAYMRTRTECGVRINLDGREPNGVVPTDEYETVRAELISLLEAVKDPDGRRVFEDVAPPETYFEGPFVDRAPDVMTIPRDFDTYLGTWLLDTEFEKPTSPSWDHTLTGVFAGWGAGVDSSNEIGEPTLYDIAPTVLSTLGIPYSSRMDGSPLPVVESTKTQPYPAYDTRAGIEATGDTVEEQLMSLGYLD